MKIENKLKKRAIELVDEFFPKEKHHGTRGNASVMMSLFLCEVFKVLDENENDKK